MFHFTICEKSSDPAHAFGVTFSPGSKPPPNVVEKATPFTPPLPTPPQPLSQPEPATPATDLTPASSSPHSTATSLTEPTSQDASVVLKQPTPEPAKPATPPPQQQQPPPPPPPKAAPKSWAALLKPTTPTPSTPSSPRQPAKPIANGLPSVQTPTLSYSTSHVPPPKSSSVDPVILVTQPPPALLLQPTPPVHPRGLVNAGNLCFANSILQALVHCPPLWRLFAQGIGPIFDRPGVLGGTSPSGGKSTTALLEATLKFVKEFKLASEVDLPSDPKPGESVKGHRSEHKKGSGASTPLTVDQLRRRAYLQDPFLPEYLWNALKDNKRFEHMTTGQQEDAEEFLGFFLEVLHEELLFVTERLLAGSAPPDSTSQKPNGKHPVSETGGSQDGSETRDVQRPLSPGSFEDGYALTALNDEDGWLEVGKKNKVSVTRNTKSSDSAITRIFEGKLRSVLQIPGAGKDSVTLEPYQSLQLDITPDHVQSIDDALHHLTQPETVSIHSTSKGTDVPAKKQVFVESLPPILILHLKRFLYDMDGGVQKSQKIVRYGSQLEIAKGVLAPTKRDGPPIRYKLFGAVYHHGKSASGGHYTIDLLRQGHSEWLRMDDTFIEPVSEDAVVITQNDRAKHVAVNPRTGVPDKVAYLLFYQRIQ